jgi:hypothetical protein
MAKERKGWKPFVEWQHQEIENTFGIKRIQEHPELDALLSNLPSLSQIEQEVVNKWQKRLELFVDSWNEEDLKMYFISKLIDLVEFHQLTYRAFFDTYLKTELAGKSIAGRVDCVLGRGSQFPQNPLFFLQEYKPQKNPSGDPLGQLLAAMLSCQKINNDTQSPLYGCYVIGRLWLFVVLQEKEYIISHAFDVANKAQLEELIGILKKIRVIYEEKLATMPPQYLGL